jgi:hypothetical protein
MSTPLLPPALVTISLREIGVSESPPNSNTGPRVTEYKAATNLNPKSAWPWCAAFVCWCVQQALLQTGTKETKTFKRPRTAGAWDFENWSREQDDSTNTKKPHRGDIRPGDIVCFTFSHIGIATSAPDPRGNVKTIEGNTDGAGSREGGAVLAKVRHVSKIRSRIRFTI